MELAGSERRLMEAWSLAQRHRGPLRLALVVAGVAGAVVGMSALAVAVIVGTWSEVGRFSALAALAISGLFWFQSIVCFGFAGGLRIDAERYAVAQKLVSAVGNGGAREDHAPPERGTG